MGSHFAQSNTNIMLRPARPVSEDAAAFRRLYTLATMSLMRAYLGRSAYDVLERLFVLPHHEHSYRLATFAETEGQTVGLLIGYSAAQHDAMSRRTLLLYLRYGLVGLVGCLPTIRQLRPLRAVTGTLPADAFYIKGLAVDASFQRRGVARHLLSAAEAQARQSGCTQMVLDVRTHNTPALTLYQACGYETLAATPVVMLRGEAVAFYRMGKHLLEI